MKVGEAGGEGGESLWKLKEKVEGSVLFFSPLFFLIICLTHYPLPTTHYPNNNNNSFSSKMGSDFNQKLQLSLGIFFVLSWIYSQ